MESIAGHGLTAHGETASCRLAVGDGSLIDCKICLAEEISSLDERSSPERQEILHRILEIVHNAGKDGITIPRLRVGLFSARPELR